MKKNENKIIWTSDDYFNEECQKEWKEDFSQMNEINPDEVTFEMWCEEVDTYLDCDREILNKELDGKILAISDLGLWDGRAAGAKTIGSNLNEFLHFAPDCEYATFYCDRYNVRSTQSHHDGTNLYLYRFINDEQEQRIKNRIDAGKEITTNYLKRNSKSLRPAVAAVYGW